MDRTLIISSDGHAMARMEDYVAYLPSRFHEEFATFLEFYRKEGYPNSAPRSLAGRTDPEIVEQWAKEVFDPGRTDGMSDATFRLDFLDAEGVAGEILFPDFGRPFELGSPFLTASLGYVRTHDQIEIGNTAYNRWLADFCSDAPERLVGMACCSFEDVDDTIKEIRFAKEAGLRGVILPAFKDDDPLFGPRFDPVWSVLEELEMPVNSHVGISSTTTRLVPMPPTPHPGCSVALFTPQVMFACQQILNHFIWGGVLERHPRLHLVLTEQGSGWVVGVLEGMDYSYEGSFLRTDVHDVIQHRPSEYFARQCHLGSSIFSRAEIEARHAIGIHKMALGVDYPHHEGTWGAGPGTLPYLKATLGSANVPPDEARLLLGENALELWSFDRAALEPLVERIGLPLDDILTPPTSDEFPRGDVKKPLATAF